MRITAGKYRGRRIESIQGKELRPTMGVTREAIFNILTHGQFTNLLPGCRVLDLFCGCGTFSIEALSRGAAHVTCMDIKPDHLQVARDNIEHIQETAHATFIRADSSNPPPASAPCDLIFMDPPYYKNLALPTLQNALKAGWLSESAVVVVETGAKEHFVLPEGFEAYETRRYSNSRIHIFKRSTSSTS